MGQSMQTPTRNTLRSTNSRLSARSLQRSSTQSIKMQKRASLSASKINSEQSFATQDNTQIRNGELFIMSRYEEKPASIKQSNKLDIRQEIINGQNSQLSPNFQSIAEAGADYGLGQWVGANGSRQSISASHQDAHHDMTISFSKTKNFYNNVFQEDNEERKSALKQILQYEEQSQNQNNLAENILLNITENQKYDSNKISAAQIISSPPTNPVAITKIINTQSPNKRILNNSIQNQCNSQEIGKGEPSKKETNLINSFDQNDYNDYDCADFKRKMKSGCKQKMSKRMEQLKQKIENKANNSKDKQSIIKGSINRLSKSFRKNRTGQSIDISRQDSKQKKPALSKIQCLNIQITSPAKDITPSFQTSKKTEENNVEPFSSKQSLLSSKNRKEQEAYLTKPRVSQQLGKTTISSQKSNSKLNKKICLNGSNSYVSQHLNIMNRHQILQYSNQTNSTNQKPKAKEPSFTEMVKKEHFGNKLKKKGSQKAQQHLKYSQVQGIKLQVGNEHIFASTCQGNFNSCQQYQFFDARDSKKGKDIQSKMNKKGINSLKMITQQLNNKQRKSKIRVTLHQLHNSQNQEQSIRNKTCQQKSTSIDRSNNLTNLNITHLTGNYSQYMLKDALKRQKEGEQWAKEQKRNYRSSQHSSRTTGVKSSKLLAF